MRGIYARDVEADQLGAAERQLVPRLAGAQHRDGRCRELRRDAFGGGALLSAVARPSASDDIVGSWPTTSRVATSGPKRDSTLLISSITVPG